MYFIIWLIFLVFIFSLALAGWSFAPWVPAFKKDLPRIANLADLKPDQKFYELGSGTGRICFYINKVSGSQAIGLEIGLPLFLISKLKQVLARNKNVKFKYRNLFKQNLSDADVVYLFGIPRTIKDKLRQKLENDLKPGAKVISYAFPIEDWQPEIIDKPGAKDVSIYLYVR